MQLTASEQVKAIHIRARWSVQRLYKFDYLKCTGTGGIRRVWSELEEGLSLLCLLLDCIFSAGFLDRIGKVVIVGCG
jgi:hypothetical protein